MVVDIQKSFPRTETIKTPDGATLVARLFLPDSAPKAAIVISGATGVPQDYYTAFATYAVERHGFAVMTYDYRDMGRSAGEPVRQSKARMSDWGITDQEAARCKLREMLPGVPLRLIGHSLGGMTLPMQRDFDGVARITCVASGSVHYNDHPWPYRFAALALWFGPGPIAAAIAGYFPGSKLGLGTDLPSGAYWQWRRWCTSRDTYGYEAGRRLPAKIWQETHLPVRLIAFSDDDLIPPPCVHRLAEHFANGKVDVIEIAPSDVGLKRIGHIEPFSKRNSAVWDHILDA